ncbi:tetratricopeptide repeat protein 27 [Diachasmimorpha longicaudata]|uniref:tetratricopeptide repeat protein 27 n=1 Tax=Diachasmimorpha longicaudata TaxID=58733 RepID=UPI0030B8A6BD
MEDDELSKVMEVSQLGKFKLAEYAARDGDALYYKILLGNLSIKLHLSALVSSENLQSTLEKSIENDYDKCIEWLCLGISSLYSFIQCNWTGPEVTEDVDWLLQKRSEAAQALALGDQCNDNVQRLQCLYLAKLIFTNKTLQSVCPTALWWLLRANLVHQLIMEEESPVLLEDSERLIEKVRELDIWKIPEFDYLETLFNVEAAQVWLFYRHIPNAEIYLERAHACAGLTLELRGAMGKRTKYQADEKAQLFLSIQTERENFPFDECPQLPMSLHLNDDLRLESIKFSESIQRDKLGCVEETIVMAKCIHLQLCQPKDHLAEEEITPYLNTIIENTKCWPLKMEALRQRCLLEMRDKRSIDRALSQSECLITHYSNPEPSVYHRTYNIFASGMKPIWHFKEILADTMLSLGMVKGALELYLKLHQWEQVIVCYTLLELRHKAAEIIRQEIAKKPTVKLWCLLGDAEQETLHYETAWKLSNETSSRAQRHWGMYYFSKQNYDEAIPHLKKSAELNNIQENVWIRLGFAALQVENWKLAATAYRRYCALEQTSFEAWNNLAKAYIKLGDKERAWHSLQDAVKCNYDKWEVWDNLMVVSIDLGYFSDVIRCYHRILELKGKHIDLQVLNILTKAVGNDVIDADGQGSGKLMHKALELFGRITSMVYNDPDVWRLYAQLTVIQGNDVDFQKAAQYLQRAYRSTVADPRWFTDTYSIVNVLQLCHGLADAYLKCSATAQDRYKKVLLGSAKLAIQAVITKVKQEAIASEDVDMRLASLEDKLGIVIHELENVKQSS